LLIRAQIVQRLTTLLVALMLLPGCGGSGQDGARSQATTQPPQATAPAVVEQTEGTGPILSDDSTPPISGQTLEGAEEGPLHRVHFEYDKSDINSEAQKVLNQNATYLKRNPATFVRIEGHCDERGSAEYNQALGERRANSAKEFLVALGVEVKRMETISYGEDRPISFEHDEYGWALNRRAEFRILSE
jgi:peptidoglycan-associated lipoprotein